MDKQSFRDMCAAMAMQGMLNRGDWRNMGVLAEQAFAAADAMTEEREKRRNPTAGDYVGKVNRGR